MESLRQNTVIHEIEAAPEIDFASTESASDQLSIDRLALLQLLWDKRQFLRRVALWAMVASTVIALLLPKTYESSVRIMPPDSMNNASGLLGAALAGRGGGGTELAALAANLLGMKGSGALFVDLFRSRSVQDQVVNRLNLQKVYWTRYKQDARKKLDSRTDVSEDRKSGVITLIVSDHSPQRARDIAQAYVEELNTVLAQVSTSSARRQRIFIEQRLMTVKGELESAEKDFSAFASKNTALDIKEQTKAMVESAATLQGQLIAAQSELQSLEQVYTGNNVRVRALQARIDELQKQLQNMRGADSSLVTDGTDGGEMYPSIRKLPLLGVEWADLYRRMKIQETVYELLNQQYELARIQEAKEIPTISVVDPANVPERKSGPYRVLIILIVTTLSITGAAVWVWFEERWRLTRADDPRKVLASQVWESVATRVKQFRVLRLRAESGSRSAGNEGPSDQTDNENYNRRDR